MDTNVNPSAAKNWLALTNVTLADDGPYFVVATDASDLSATSQVATLTIDPTFTKITHGSIVTNRGDTVGLQWGDYDGDGFPDLLVCNEGSQRQFLYRNKGDGTFREATTNEVGDLVTKQFNGCFAVWFDYDNDGRMDLFQGSWEGRSRLFHNEGDGRLAEVTENLGAWCNGWGVSVVDFDNDGWLDLSVAYSNTLLRNLGGARFVRPSPRPGAGNSQFWCWADCNNDGFMDLYIGSNTETSIFYINQGGIFSKGVGVVGGGWAGSWGDYNNDGFMDLYAQRLFVNDAQGKLVAAPGGPAIGALSAWGDYDNDGNLDLLVVDQSVSRVLLYHNSGDGTFTKVLAGSVGLDVAAYAIPTWCDYNNDGALDLMVGVRSGGGPDVLYRNNGNGNHWLIVKPKGTMSNTPGIGATVRVEAIIGGKRVQQMRQILGGIADDLRAHFGLGDATKVDLVQIKWPSGLVQELRDVAPNQLLILTEHQEGVTSAPGLTAARSTEGLLQLTLTGQANLLYVFEASKNLVQWAKLGVRTNLTGTVDYTDTAATNDAQRFYRAVAP